MKKVFVTGDGPCPWCGKIIVGDKSETHHNHVIGDEGEVIE